jgi:serine protease Do
MRSLIKSLAGGLFITFVITAWFVSPGACQPTQSQAGSPKKVTQTNTSARLEQYFQKAKEELRNNTVGASAEIRRAASFVKEKADQAQGRSKELILESYKELEDLGDRVQQGAVKTAEELNQTFTRVHLALANYYHQQASDSWANQAASDARRELSEAELHLKNAWQWSKSEANKAYEEAVDSAKQLGAQIAQDSGRMSAEIGRTFEELGKKITELHENSKGNETQGTISRVSRQGPAVESKNLATTIIDVAKACLPAVVHIEVTERSEILNPMLPFENDPFFRHFFGFNKKMPKKFKQERVGVGTGMIIDEQGHIVSNHHVVGGASKIVVTLSDGTQYDATVVGTDPKTDLGVIKISANPTLPFVTFADSDQVQVGQWVVAIGQPRNLAQSVTQGIISAKHRRGITDPGSYQDFLQTDAAINPGNSGGPLLNLQGQVVGVNSAILSESGGFEGIGFAIPSNMAVRIVDQLLKNGKVVRGWMGISIQDLTPDLAKSFGLQLPKGALIADVTKDGPADKAGLKKGDVILAYQGKEIDDSSALRNAAANTSPGQEATVTIWRAKKKEEVLVKIGNAEELTKILVMSVKGRLGAEVRPLTAQEAQEYGMDSPSGVRITWLDPKGPLGKAGFEVGDAILTVNGQPIPGLEGLDAMLGQVKSHEKVALGAVDHRTGQMGNVELELP